MEGASRGAVEAGGHTVGVTCGIFDSRPPNPYLREHVTTADLHDRTRELIRRSEAFVVLEGKAGTLAELTFLWALARARCLDGSPVILLGARWSRLIRLLEQDGWLERSQLETTHLVDDPKAAVKRIERTTHGGPRCCVNCGCTARTCSSSSMDACQISRCAFRHVRIVHLCVRSSNVPDSSKRTASALGRT